MGDMDGDMGLPVRRRLFLLMEDVDRSLKDPLQTCSKSPGFPPTAFL